MQQISRRNVLKGLVALGALNGCRTVFPGRTPDLRLGVISDIHIMTPETA